LKQLQSRAPILLLAGDIGNPQYSLYEEFLSQISSSFDKIFIISGNHEYYNENIERTDQIIKSMCNRYKNIVFLQNSFEDYNGYRFAGCTFWSLIKDKEYLTNDFHYIHNFNVDEYNHLHDQSKSFVKTMLETSPNPIIMMSHHVPSNNVIDPMYRRFQNYQQCFSSDSEHLIRYPIHSWIYGHTHRSFKGNINGVNLYCNPIGYPGENSKFSFNETFEVPDLVASEL
jgi:predicted phosphohydrolase